VSKDAVGERKKNNAKNASQDASELKKENGGTRCSSVPAFGSKSIKGGRQLRPVNFCQKRGGKREGERNQKIGYGERLRKTTKKRENSERFSSMATGLTSAL